MNQEIYDIICNTIDHKGSEFMIDRNRNNYELTDIRAVLYDLGFTFVNRKTYYNSVVELYKCNAIKLIVKLNIETFNIYITAK